jgi:hypothetical protein
MSAFVIVFSSNISARNDVYICSKITIENVEAVQELAKTARLARIILLILTPQPALKIIGHNIYANTNHILERALHK